MPEQDHLPIGEVAKKCGISVRALRYYEELGLICPAGRTGAGQRLYTPEVLDDIQIIQCYKKLGFRLKDIGQFCENCSGCGACGRSEDDRRQVMIKLLETRRQRLLRLLSVLQRDLSMVESGLQTLGRPNVPSIASAAPMCRT